MNPAPSTQEKRTVKVKEFLDDFHSGMTDRTLMEKYHLTTVGLDKFYTMLLERNILGSSDFQARGQFEEPEMEVAADNPRFVCPSCLTTQVEMFETCPQCGASSEEHADGSEVYDEGVGYEAYHQQPVAAAPAFGVEGGAEADAAFAADEPRRDSGPIELPLSETFGPDGLDAPIDEEVAAAKEFEKLYSEFGETGDQVVPGMPLDYAEYGEDREQSRLPTCEQCGAALEPVVRKTYDRNSGLMTLAISGIFLLLGFAGAVGLTFFQSYSAARLAVIYGTGMAILLGCALLALALVMLFFARERAYVCRQCRRVFPRV